ncbi:MAG: hypothetical protein Q7S37_02950 [bacterium]|nr:hypothetical protein [bacterium]
MYATIKIVGVTPDAIGRLHKLVADAVCQTSEEITVNTVAGTSTGKQKYVRIEESKFDSAHETYTVTLKFFLSFMDRNEKYQTYQPMMVMRSVLQSIDPKLVPVEETREDVKEE